jgi:hypothetical protein
MSSILDGALVGCWFTVARIYILDGQFIRHKKGFAMNLEVKEFGFVHRT